MSRIDELIREKCPDGVAVKPLGEIAELVRGNGMPKALLTEVGVGAIHYGQIYTRYGVWTKSTISSVSPADAAKLAKAEPGDIIITNTSENVEDVGKAVAWLGAEQIVTGGHATIIKHCQDAKFLSYWFQSASFTAQKKALATGTKVIDVSAKQLAKVRVPVPPLEVQREIARILDHFTKLEAKLEAELTARRLQYKHYCDRLLSFDTSVQWATLGEICHINRGRVMSKDYLRDHAGPYPVYSSQTANAGVFGYVDTFDYDSESITWTTDGANAGSVFYHCDERFSITNVCGLLEVCSRELISTRFLFYMLGQLTKKHVREGMGNPKLMGNIMSRIKVPLPAIGTQQQIVAVLDNFELLANDLSVGLPSELAARRKQYEYYRDRLLTFKELPA